MNDTIKQALRYNTQRARDDADAALRLMDAIDDNRQDDIRAILAQRPYLRVFYEQFTGECLQ